MRRRQPAESPDGGPAEALLSQPQPRRGPVVLAIASQILGHLAVRRHGREGPPHLEQHVVLRLDHGSLKLLRQRCVWPPVQVDGLHGRRRGSDVSHVVIAVSYASRIAALRTSSAASPLPTDTPSREPTTAMRESMAKESSARGAGRPKSGGTPAGPTPPAVPQAERSAGRRCSRQLACGLGVVRSRRPGSRRKGWSSPL